MASALFCQTGMDGNMNIIILRLHPTRGSPNDVCLVANAGITVLHALICARYSEYRPERGLQARSSNYGIMSDPRAGPAGHESGPPAGSCKCAKILVKG